MGRGGGAAAPPGEQAETGFDGGQGRQRRCEDPERGGGADSEEEQDEIRDICEDGGLCGECGVG